MAKRKPIVKKKPLKKYAVMVINRTAKYYNVKAYSAEEAEDMVLGTELEENYWKDLGDEVTVEEKSVTH